MTEQQELGNEGATTKPFYWLASYPKSGNTWVRLFLASYLTGGPVNINELPTALTFGDLKPYMYQAVAPCGLEKLTELECVHIRHAALFHIIAFMGGQTTLLKTHNANVAVWGTKLFHPETTEAALYLVRDPRDVVVSVSSHMGMSIDEAIDFMNTEESGIIKEPFYGLKHFLNTWSNHVESWAKADFKTTIVKYEDLLEEPVKFFSKIVECLGWELNERAVEEALENTKLDFLKDQEKTLGFMEASEHSSFFNRGTKGHWKDILNADQVGRIEGQHGKIMKALGYLE